MKAPGRYQPVAESIASELPSEVAAYFLLGCGLLPGSYDHCKRALERPGFAEILDPRPTMSGLRCPITIVHGLDDDVIPYTESQALYRELRSFTDAELHLTGLFDHSRSVAKLGAGLGELTTLGKVCLRLAI